MLGLDDVKLGYTKILYQIYLDKRFTRQQSSKATFQFELTCPTKVKKQTWLRSFFV